MPTAHALDLRHALRSLRRSPAFVVLSAGTLGLAIGAGAGIWSVIQTVLLDPLPWAEPSRLVYIAATAPGSDLPSEFGVAAEFFLEYRDESRLLDGISTFNSFTASLRTPDRVERVPMSTPTPSLFETLGARPVLGRLPTVDDGDGVAVMSHRLWRDWFGSDPGILGRSFEMAGKPRTVIGVMGPDFWFPSQETVVWIPYPVRNQGTGLVPGRFGLPLVARLAPGATAEALADELTTLARRLPDRFGGSPTYTRIIEQHRAVVRPLRDQILGSIAEPLWVLQGATVIVLLIACANVANLFLVRWERRQRDLAVRRALGAGRAALMRAQMIEVLAVATIAGALALLLAWATVPLLLRAAPAEVPRLAEVGIGPGTLLFTFAATLLAAGACGLLPAVRASAVELGKLRDGGRGTTRRRHLGRSVLVTGQTALALVLLVGAGLLLRSFERLRSVDPGYDTTDVFTFQIAPEGAHLSDGPSYARFHLDFMERLRALPGVESVGLVENVPLNEGVARSRFRTPETPDEEGAGTLLGITFAAGDYFRTMGIERLAGEDFTNDDQTADRGHVILSRSAAELLWPGQDPIGRRLWTEDAERARTVVGVVEDVRQYDFRREPEPLLYLPLVGPTPDAWVISSPAYVLRTERAEVIAPEVRELVREVAPSAPMYRVFTMAGLAADSMVALSFTLLTLAIAAALALLLGAVGLFGVLSFAVAERTQEIGVRMALGARAEQVRRMVVAQGARVAAAGALVGTLVAIAATRALRSLLYGVGALDALTFVVTAAVLLAVALLASYLPARRASSVDPVEALRAE